MKKNFPPRNAVTEIRRSGARGLASLLAVFAIAASTGTRAHANGELDRQYALETVGALKSLDNVDGLFADYVAQAYKDYFQKQSRFTYQDLSKADQILGGSKLPYSQIVNDAELLGQLSRVMRTEALIRTKIYKEGPRYRFTQDFLHAPKMDVLSTHTFSLEEVRDGTQLGLGDLKGALQKGLNEMIRKVPYLANVTGRDESSVTVNIGANQGLNRGDILVVATLDEVKKHPLLQEIVDWRFTQIGKLVVQEVDEGIAFCRVVQEEPGRQISRYQKVISVQAKPQEAEAAPLGARGQDRETRAERAEKEQKGLPSLGWAAPGIWLGGYSRDYSLLNQAGGRSGSGFLLGAKGQGELWLTREWFAELGLGFGSSSYSQKNILTGAESTSLSSGPTVFDGRLAVGYNIFSTPDLFGPRAWAKFGFQWTSYNHNVLAAEYLGASSYSSVFLGLGGDLPVRGEYGVSLSLDLGIFNGASATGVVVTDVDSARNAHFFLGGYYRIEPRMTFRAGLDVLAQGATFKDGSELTQKVISFVPSLLFYF